MVEKFCTIEIVMTLAPKVVTDFMTVLLGYILKMIVKFNSGNYIMVDFPYEL